MADSDHVTVSALQAFGLTEPEVRLYLTLLTLGSQPASVLARKAGLKRGHTYNMLTLLREKGMVQEFIRNGVKIFAGCHPKGLLSLLERREEDLDDQKRKLMQILPDLERLGNPLIAQPRVRFFQGTEGVREIYEDTLRIRNQPIHALVDFEHCFPGEHNRSLNDWMWRYTERRAERGIWYWGIVNKSAISDLAYRRRTKQKRKMKMLTGVELSVEVNIYGNKVAIVSSSRDMVGLIIEDKPIADTLRNFHQEIWSMLPEYRP